MTNTWGENTCKAQNRKRIHFLNMEEFPEDQK